VLALSSLCNRMRSDIPNMGYAISFLNLRGITIERDAREAASELCRDWLSVGVFRHQQNDKSQQ
jgi:hypothetical protein